jgi:hypothetical protein
MKSQLIMGAAKSDDLEFSPPYPGNSSKEDAQSQTMSFSVRPGAMGWTPPHLIGIYVPN